MRGVRHLSNGEIEDARKHASHLKECGIAVIIFGALILIASIWIMGMAMGRFESPWVVYAIPTQFIKDMAGLGMFFGSVITFIGALTTYLAVKTEGILSRRT